MQTCMIVTSLLQGCNITNIKDKRKHHGAQWINVLQNNTFVNLTQLPLQCERTGALAIVELGLTAGRLTGMLLGRQKCCKARNFKFCILDF